MAESSEDERKAKKNHLIERIATGVGGVLLLALQGINISETGGNGELIRRVEQLVMQEKAEAVRLDQALARQEQMLKVLESQQETKH